ncbi:4a-hydroxytetrahydrobiopterin dehydratase [Marinagarivorans algicola]|uniref:4a-hydroxytetrahydrobiopterin dehydratase n=1 Tax=Marinagarivorans algicola TaxID=1513270 RepID=UPI0006B8CA17|nr:4a-hydroxytetrahydrobiopterin dehydratase [Marinagarivorans algicola]
MTLADQHCLPCGRNGQALTSSELSQALVELPSWDCIAGNAPKLECTYHFENFSEALAFTNAVGVLAEQYQHHPTLAVAWGQVRVQWWTHNIQNIHHADVVMAAKTQRIYNRLAPHAVR